MGDASGTDNTRLLNWRQVCKLLGCKRSHFYNLVNSGRIPAIRIGRQGSVRGIRVDEADVLRFLRECKRTDGL